MKFDAPIFVRGFSRSGGTLLVSILDAHSEISMNYELYEGLLATPQPEKSAEFDISGEGYDILEVAAVLEPICVNIDNQEKIALKALREAGFNSVGVFMARMARGGLLSQDFYSLINEWLNHGRTWQSASDRLKFIGFCAHRKSVDNNCAHWGLKCSNSFEKYLGIWPKAKFINIIRDPRDVYASQLVTGNFSPSPAVLSNNWKQLHLKFDIFKKAHPQNAYSYKYEDLVDNPEIELKKIFDFLSVKYEPGILTFNEKNLSIFENPRGHLSIDRIAKPIDRSSVGRHVKDISKEEIKIIEEICQNQLNIYQYE